MKTPLSFDNLWVVAIPAPNIAACKPDDAGRLIRKVERGKGRYVVNWSMHFCSRGNAGAACVRPFYQY